MAASAAQKAEWLHASGAALDALRQDVALMQQDLIDKEEETAEAEQQDLYLEEELDFLEGPVSVWKATHGKVVTDVQPWMVGGATSAVGG